MKVPVYAVRVGKEAPYRKKSKIRDTTLKPNADMLLSPDLTTS